MTRIDHVLLATTSLPHGEQQLLRAYGLHCQPGGSHLLWGTANLIVPIGSQYLELIAVENPGLASTSLLGRAVIAGAHRDRLTPIGLCLLADDLEEVARRLGQRAEPGARALADGSEVRWTTVGVEQAFGAARLPFFISWQDPTRHPAAATPEPGASNGEIAEVEVGGSEEVLLSHLGSAIPGVRAVGGPPGIRSITLRLADDKLLHLP